MEHIIIFQQNIPFLEVQNYTALYFNPNFLASFFMTPL